MVKTSIIEVIKGENKKNVQSSNTESKKRSDRKNNAERIGKIDFKKRDILG